MFQTHLGSKELWNWSSSYKKNCQFTSRFGLFLKLVLQILLLYRMLFMLWWLYIDSACWKIRICQTPIWIAKGILLLHYLFGLVEEFCNVHFFVGAFWCINIDLCHTVIRWDDFVTSTSNEYREATFFHDGGTQIHLWMVKSCQMFWTHVISWWNPLDFWYQKCVAAKRWCWWKGSPAQFLREG